MTDQHQRSGRGTELIGQTRSSARRARYLWLLFDTRDWYDGDLFTSYAAAKRSRDDLNRGTDGGWWKIRKFTRTGKAKP